MYTTRKNNNAVGNISLFGNLRVMMISALFIAMSIVLGKLLAFNLTPFIRVSFENLPILMAGIFFGPFIGAAVGVCADLIGCMIVGYAINPFITLGGAMIGIVSGLISMMAKKSGQPVNVFFSVMISHVIGSMLIKSVGLYIYYGTPVKALMIRIPLYIGIGLLEFGIIFMLLKNKAFSAQLDKVCNKNGKIR